MRIARLSLTSAAAERLAGFYEGAFGCARVGVEERQGAALAGLMGLSAARARMVRLRLGAQAVEIAAFTPPGRPYPDERASNDPAFQHMAIVVSDMRAAYDRLCRQPGWTPITAPEPQRLPARSGGVTAFKFRDPEGHPLELLEFPPAAVPPAWQGQAGVFRGIDHSAIVVAETARSVAFYHDLLGFTVGLRSLNRGIEQERLDGLPGAVAEVTALAPAVAPPHLELLCYRSPAPSPSVRLSSNDVAATRLVLEVDDLPALIVRARAARVEFISREASGASALLRDPDGHALWVMQHG